MAHKGVPRMDRVATQTVQRNIDFQRQRGLGTSVKLIFAAVTARAILNSGLRYGRNGCPQVNLPTIFLNSL